MSVAEITELTDHMTVPFVGNVLDAESNLLGYLAIDSTVRGRSYGGLRMLPDVSPSELAEHAKLMTLKNAFLGLPFGGAKAGIVADLDISLEKKRARLKAFGKAVLPLLKSHCYSPSGDMETTDEDIRFMLSANGLRIPSRSLEGRSGFYTGLSVFAAAARTAQRLGVELRGSSIAIEGFGKVGSSVARIFWERGVRVVAISTMEGAIYREKGLDIGELLRLYSQLGSRIVKAFQGAERIEKSKLLELEVDILSPCAGYHSIKAENARRITAKIISPGANLPVAPQAEQILFQRGVVCLPDFIASCGGVLGATMRFTGLSEGYIRGFIEQRVAGKVAEVLEAVERENMNPKEYAQKITEQRFPKIKESAEKASIVNRIFYGALGLYRIRMIPSFAVRVFSPRYFSGRLE